MINKKKKKGFTIVELVIVIVIVGVLAAVLIPTFGSLIQKANESADKQTVYQMNIIISSELVENEELIDENGTLNIEKFKEVLEKNGFDVDNLGPTSEDLEFMWDKVNKVVILVRDENNALTQIYPEANAGDAPIANKITQGIVQVLGSSSSSEGGEDVPFDVVSAISTAIDAAIAAGTNSATVTLMGPAEITDLFEIPENFVLTLELNEEALVIADTEESEFDKLGLIINGTLIINGGDVLIKKSVSKDFSAVNFAPGIRVNGSLTLNEVTITGERNYNIENYGTLNLKNTEFTVKTGYGIYNDGRAEIIGGKIIADGKSLYIIEGKEGSELTINGTVFSETSDSVTYATNGVINCESSKGLTLTDVTINSDETNVSSTKGTLTISGGTFNGGLSGAPIVITADNEKNTFNGAITCYGIGNSITGGTFNGLLTSGNGAETTINDGIFNGGFKFERTEVKIKDGEFSINKDGDDANKLLYFYHDSDVTITGGTFNSQLKWQCGTSNNTKITIYKTNAPTFYNGSESVSFDNITKAILTADSDNCTLSGDKENGWVISKPS